MGTAARRPDGWARRVVALWGPLVVATGVGSAFIVQTRFTWDGRTYFSLFDDAMVSMRYARNLALGEGLVWNPGHEAVEGYTNFLWTLWMGALHAIVRSQRFVPLAVAISSLALILGTVALVRALANRIADRDGVAVMVATWLTALFYPLLYWSLRGMEVAALSVALVGAVLVVAQLREEVTPLRAWLLAGIAAAGVLIRTDAAVPLGAIVAGGLLLVPVRERLRLALTVGGVTAATLAAHFLFRLAYYGSIVPNTYYLKMEGTPLAARLERGGIVIANVLGYQLLVPVVIVAVALVVFHRRVAGIELVAVAGFIASCAYAVYVGGDAWEWMQYANRYIAPSVPLLLLVTGVGVARFADVHISKGARLAVGTVFGAGAMFAFADPTASMYADHPSFFLGSRMGLTGHALAGTIVLGLLAVAIATVGGTWTGWLRGGLATIVGVGILAATNLTAYHQWVTRSAYHVVDDAIMSQRGLLLREATEPDATLAVVWAGSTPYFARRATFDLLGKNDEHIAHLEGVQTFFYPGHNKWDYGYSIREQEPDVVVGLWMADDEIRDRLRSWGYRHLEGPNFWVLTGSPDVIPERM